MVSVFMLTYNHEKYIRQAIESILMQKVNFRYEIVIGEDASPDGTRHIVQEYARKYPDIVRAYCRKKNIGAIRNSISTFKKCTGKYIAFLEGDDFWNDENKLQTQIDFLEKNLAYSMCFTDVDMIKDYAVRDFYAKKDIENVEQLLGDRKRVLCIPTATLVCRNYFKTEPELYRYFKGLNIVGDRITHAIMMKRGKAKYIPMKSATYRRITRGGDSFSSSTTRVRYDDMIRAYKNCMNMYGLRYFHLWMKHIAGGYKSLFQWLRKNEGIGAAIKEYIFKTDIVEKIYTLKGLIEVLYED